MTGPRAVRTGNRVRRRRLLVAASLLLAASVGWVGVLGYGWAARTDWNRHKPVWWLIRDASGPDVATRDAAMAELLARSIDGRMAAAEIAELVDRALAHQADAARVWVPAWGILVEALRDNGKVPDPAYDRYLRQAVAVAFEAQPRMRSGGPLPGRVTVGLSRLGTPARYSTIVGGTQVTVGDVQFHVKDRRAIVRQWWPPGGNRAHPFSDLLADVEPRPPVDAGPRAARLSVHVMVYDGAAMAAAAVRTVPVGPRGPVGPRPGAVPPARVPLRPVPEFEVTTKASRSVPVVVVPADWNPGRVDPNLRGAVERSLQVSAVQWGLPGAPEIRLMSATLTVRDPPVALAFSAWAVTDGGEFRMGEVICHPGQTAVVQLQGDVRGVFERKIKLELRPDRDVALTVPDVHEFWGEAVVMPDLPVAGRP